MLRAEAIDRQPIDLDRALIEGLEMRAGRGAPCQHPCEPFEDTRTDAFGRKVDVFDAQRGNVLLNEVVQAVAPSIAQEAADQIVRPRVEGQAGSIEPVDGLV